VRLLDLFCGAGGAAMGYHRAGFEVVGVDIKPQPRYPFTFVRADALEALQCVADGVWGHFDVIHASPPCQVYSKGAGQARTRHLHQDLIRPVRRSLPAGVPYVIENIEQARDRLLRPVMLCGETFGLGVFRHRYFESNVKLRPAPHRAHQGKVGDGTFYTVTGQSGGISRRDGIRNGSIADWRKAMGIEWMTIDELSQAIPPAYTEFVGRQLI
jgi:DNA (cytosine-5)-methyltransferase 1